MKACKQTSYAMCEACLKTGKRSIMKAMAHCYYTDGYVFYKASLSSV